MRDSLLNNFTFQWIVVVIIALLGLRFAYLQWIKSDTWRSSREGDIARDRFLNKETFILSLVLAAAMVAASLIKVPAGSTSIDTPSGYKTFVLGNTRWLGQNLNIDVPGSEYYENDEETYGDKYGRLYTWSAANEGCKKLGRGWRLPNERDFEQLWGNDNGGYSDYVQFNPNIKHGDVKQGYNNNKKGTQFNALLSGYKEGAFKNIYQNTSFWANGSSNSNLHYYYEFNSLLNEITKNQLTNDDVADKKYSCRCVLSLKTAD